MRAAHELLSSCLEWCLLFFSFCKAARQRQRAESRTAEAHVPTSTRHAEWRPRLACAPCAPCLFSAAWRCRCRSRTRRCRCRRCCRSHCRSAAACVCAYARASPPSPSCSSPFCPSCACCKGTAQSNATSAVHSRRHNRNAALCAAPVFLLLSLLGAAALGAAHRRRKRRRRLHAPLPLRSTQRKRVSP